jgi:hypothetical protein
MCKYTYPEETINSEAHLHRAEWVFSVTIQVHEQITTLVVTVYRPNPSKK